MFDVGFWELVILFGLGLMILGPERMPKVASQLGRWAGQARRMARNLTSQIRDEIEPFESSMKSMDETLRKDFSAMRPDVGADAGQSSQAPADTQQAAAEEADAAGTATRNAPAPESADPSRKDPA